MKFQFVIVDHSGSYCVLKNSSFSVLAVSWISAKFASESMDQGKEPGSSEVKFTSSLVLGPDKDSQNTN